MSDTFEKVRKMVADHLDKDAESITMESNFIDDLGADSLDAVEVVMEAEETFDIEIPDEVSETLATVGALVEFIDSVKG